MNIQALLVYLFKLLKSELVSCLVKEAVDYAGYRYANSKLTIKIIAYAILNYARIFEKSPVHRPRRDYYR